HVDFAHAMTGLQALATIDVSCPFADQAVAFPVRAPEILLVDTGNANHRPDVTVALAPCDQRPQQHADINPIRLCSACAPVDLHAGRVDHQTFNASTTVMASQKPHGSANFTVRRILKNLRFREWHVVVECTSHLRGVLGASPQFVADRTVTTFSMVWIVPRMVGLPQRTWYLFSGTW